MEGVIEIFLAGLGTFILQDWEIFSIVLRIGVGGGILSFVCTFALWYFGGVVDAWLCYSEASFQFCGLFRHYFFLRDI